MYKSFFLFIIVLAQLISCTPAEKQVTVKTQGIFIPVEVTLNGEEDRGEFLIGGRGDVITIDIKNNTEYALTELAVDIEEGASAGVKFFPDLTGKSTTPGYEGTCGSVLASKAQCRFKLFFKASISGNLEQKLTVHYKNLVDSEQREYNLKFLSGEAASLIVTSDIVNYSFGLVEREDSTFSDVFDLEISNAGELAARSITFSREDNPRMNPLPGTEAVKILLNDCPELLVQGQKCNMRVGFTPQNYSSLAPDGDRYPVDYNSQFTFSYSKDPEGGVGTLKTYFGAKSTRIAGKLESAGVIDLEYDEPVISGNRATKVIKVQNKGYKEAILKRIDIRDDSFNIVASCVRDGGKKLSCRNKLTPTDPLSEIVRELQPFEINDNNDCVNPVALNSYTRLADGSLSDPNVVEISGRSLSEQGQSCFFDLTFQPSVKKLTDGSYNDWNLAFVYDSTFRNTIEIWGDEADSQLASERSIINFKSASYYAASYFPTIKVNYANTEYLHESIDTSTPNVKKVYFNLGRVALVRNTSGISVLSPYAQNLKIEFKKDVGFSSAKVQSVTHGDGTQVPTTYPVGANKVYRNYYHNFLKEDTCSEVLSIGMCRISGKFSPVTSNKADPLEFSNEIEYSTNDSGSYKKYTLVYSDGATLEDDGSAHALQTIEIYLKITPIKKGYLVFEDSIIGTASRVAGDEGYFGIDITNVGTDNVPYIRMKTASGIIYPTNANSPYPFAYEQNPKSGFLAGNKNCYDLGLTSIFSTPSGTPNPSDYLGIGETCRLVIKHKARKTDVFGTNSYSDAQLKWEIPFMRNEFGGDLWERWEPLPLSSQLSFDMYYYDGDGIADPPNNYYPDVENFGNRKTVFSSTLPYRVSAVYNKEASIIPDNPLPTNFALLWRPDISLPLIPADGPPGHVSSSVAAANIPAQYLSSLDVTGEVPAYRFENSKLLASNDTLTYNNSSTDYSYYGGSYQSGNGPYNTGFSLYNAGGTAATEVSLNWVGGDAEIDFTPVAATSIAPYNSISIPLVFTPTTNTNGSYSRVLEITYKSGRRDIDGSDLTNYVYLPRVNTIRVNVSFEGREINSIQASLSYEKYIVRFDKVTKAETGEVLTDAQTSVSTKINSWDNSSGYATLDFIKGATDSKRRGKFTITNNGINPMYNLSLYLASNPGSPVLSNGLPDGSTAYYLHSSTCNLSLLSPGQSCTFQVDFLPKTTTSPISVAIVMGYSFSATGQDYVSQGARLYLNAKDPAFMKISGNSLSPTLYCTETNLACTQPTDVSKQFPACSSLFEGCAPYGQTRNSYKFQLGTFNNSFHPVYTENNKVLTISNVRFENESTERASFLAQYRLRKNELGDPNYLTADIPATGSWFELYNKSNIRIEANRACFHGDKLGDPSTWGFQKYDSTNICYMNIYYTLTVDEIADLVTYNKQLSTSRTHVRLLYYNNERSSHDEMFLHFSGYLEFDKSSVSDSTLIDVDSNSSGELSFSWHPYSEDNPSVGAIIGYRVFYTALGANLEANPMTILDSYYDTVTPELNMSGLNPGSFYKFKIVPKRMMSNGKTTLSRTPVTPYEIVIPKSGANYDYYKKIIIDDYLSPKDNLVIGTKSEITSVCNFEISSYLRNGVTQNFTKKLINLDIFNLIHGDEDYNTYDMDSIPHWMSDDPFDAIPYFENLDCSQNTGANDASDIFYQKTCGDCSCMDLSVLKGGDGRYLPLGATVFTEAELGSGAARCYISY